MKPIPKETKKETTTVSNDKKQNVQPSDSFLKKYGPDVLKIVSGVAVGTAIGIGIKHLYDSRKPEKLLQNWDTRSLLFKVANTWEHSKIVGKDGQVVDANDEYCWILSSNQLEEKNIINEPKVLSIYNALYELYTKLLESDEVKNLHFKKTIDGYDENDNRKYYVLDSFDCFLGFAGTKNNDDNDVLWNVREQCKHDTGAHVLACDMPVTTGDIKYRADILKGYTDANFSTQKKITYEVTFKMLNGKLTFEKLEFVNNDNNDNDNNDNDDDE